MVLKREFHGRGSLEGVQFRELMEASLVWGPLMCSRSRLSIGGGLERVPCWWFPRGIPLEVDQLGRVLMGPPVGVL